MGEVRVRLGSEEMRRRGKAGGGDGMWGWGVGGGSGADWFGVIVEAV